AKLGEIVQSYDRVLIARQQIIQPRLILHQVVDSRSIFKGPFHMGDQPGEREPLLDAAVKDLLDEREHPVLIEVTIAQIGVSPVASLALTARFPRLHVDSGRRESPRVLRTKLGIDDMERLLAPLE